MSTETGFVLSSEEIRRAYLRILPWVLIGIVVGPAITGRWNPTSLLETTLLVAAIFAATFWITKRYKWIRLSSAGIHGSSLRGAKVVISWSEPISIRRMSYSGLSGVEVKPQSKGAAIFLPLSIATSTEFKAKLVEVAPPGHQLHSVGRDAL